MAHGVEAVLGTNCRSEIAVGEKNSLLVVERPCNHYVGSGPRQCSGTPANERWDVGFFADGSVEIERFVSAGLHDAGPARLEELFRD